MDKIDQILANHDGKLLEITRTSNSAEMALQRVRESASITRTQLIEAVCEEIEGMKTYFISDAQYYTREDYVRGWNEFAAEIKSKLRGEK